MTKIIATSKERLIKYLDYKGVKMVDFFKNSGIKRGFLDTDKLKSTISDVFLAKIIAFFPDLNVKWLITGEGEMELYERVVNEPKAVYALKTDRLLRGNQTIPLYDIEAVAGLVPLFDSATRQNPIDHISIPGLPKCDGAIKVTGDSMYPLLKSGDIIMYKKVNDIMNDVFWGEMYLLSVATDDEEYVTVKYIQRSDKGEEWVRLVSQNQHHQDRDIHRKKIKALALVKASIRINSMS